MDEGSTQTWLFVCVLGAGIYVVLSDGFYPWLILVILGIWRRFSPTQSGSIPFVLNESTGFDDRSKNRIGIAMVALLLLGFPGMMPVGELQDWDSGLDTSEWPTDVSFAPGESGSLEFPLKVIGVNPIDVEFQITFGQNQTKRSSITSSLGHGRCYVFSP